MAADGSSNGVDQNLYSRQIGVFGMETMGKLIKMDVLIVGMKGVGIETAKNLCLAGPRSVTIYDPETVQEQDLAYNYYLTKESVGQRRDQATVSKLAELNGYVKTTVMEGELNEAALSNFTVVCFTNTPLADLVKYNTYCRTQSPAIGFIAADVRGVAGRAFVDYGDNHRVIDPDGEPTRSAIIAGMYQDEGEALTVQCHDAKRHGFSDGEHVIFREVEGAEQLNDGVPRKITNCTKFTFQLAKAEDGSVEKVADYTGQGVVQQAKVPRTHAFASLQDRIAAPVPSDDPMGMLITPDLGKFGRPEQLHAAFQGLDAYAAANGSLPSPHDADAISGVVEATKKFVEGADGFDLEVEEDVAAQLARYAAVELPALAAFYGGVVAQEIVKFTGKFSPLRQWLYLDAFEVATPTDGAPEGEFAATGDRYYFSNVIFGKHFTQHIREQKVFLVGAGALGCEFLKNFALAGVGTAGEGGIIVTDMDNIETSNLNRQFLFRNRDVGAAKSTTAANAAMDMNPDLEGRVKAMETRVGTDTETTFNDEFWGGVSFVTNALDNVKARQYVDARCVWYNKPLLESGTLGTKANTQVVLPSMTESYGDSQDPPEESIPMCTLKNFPNQIEHCIEWARDNFEGYFVSAAQDAKAFAGSPGRWLKEAGEEKNDFVRRGKLQKVRDTLEAASNASWDACVHKARLAFNADYYGQIRQLLHNFPPGHTTSEGAPFWSGPKRCPTAAEFDLGNELHVAYVAHAAALFASVFGIELPEGYDTAEVLSASLSKLDVPAWEPKNVKIKSGDDDDTEEGGDDDGAAAAQLTAALEKMAAEKGEVLKALETQLQPAEFEKDDDSNHHIDFITASANLRGTNYSIKVADRHKVKMIAGKIIPAIATTTCMVTGLVLIEAYQVIRQMMLPVDERRIEPLRNSFVNLAVNVYSMSEPAEPKRVTSKEFDPIMGVPVRAVPENHTKWERTIIPKDAGIDTMRKLSEFLKNEYSSITAREAAKEGAKAPALKEGEIDVTMILVGSTMLYANMYKSHAERLDMNIVEAYNQFYLKGEGSLDKPYLSFTISAETESGDELSTPPVQLFV